MQDLCRTTAVIGQNVAVARQRFRAQSRGRSDDLCFLCLKVLERVLNEAEVPICRYAQRPVARLIRLPVPRSALSFRGFGRIAMMGSDGRRMSPQTERLTPTEAAVVAGVSVRDVHRMIDEQILPGSFYNASQPRSFKRQACVFISFYFGSADSLTAEERQRTIALASKSATAKNSRIIRDEFLTIDFAPFRKTVEERLERLDAARVAIVSDPEILSGTPVIRGTRVPAYDIAASVAAGSSVEEILASYPSLKQEQVELASLYAEANPLRGRPRQRIALPPGSKLISSTRHRLPTPHDQTAH